MLKKRYQFLALLSCTRAFTILIKNQKGETEIRAWIEELLQKTAHDFDVSIRQKLLRETLDRDISPALMLASVNNRFPVLVQLPTEWRRFLQAKGASLHPLSGLFWWISIMQKFRLGLGAYKMLLANTQPHGSSYAVLCGLHDSAFSSSLSGTPAQDFLAWFRSYFSFSHEWVVSASRRSSAVPERTAIVLCPFPALRLTDRLFFKKLARKEIARSFMNLFMGNWKPAYILADSLEAIYMKIMPQDQIADLYAFTNAQYIYRPLWTYEAERRGAQIALFFYAMNTFDVKLKGGGSIGLAPGYSMMTWPLIYTQHQNHREFLKNIAGNTADIRVTGLMSYEDNGQKADISGKIRILYLDVQPFRSAFMAGIGRPCHIYTDAISRETFDDISRLSKTIKATLFIKPKRFVGNRLSRFYQNMLLNARDKGDIKILDSGISPKRLCEEVDVVICQPFTSAALFAQAAGKPVAYYDAPGLFERDQPAGFGVPILQGPAELQNWLMEVMRVSKAVA